MNWTQIVFMDLRSLIRIFVVGVLAYCTLVLFLRIAGKRTPAELNAFSFVVAFALASTLSAILLQEAVAMAEGAAALGLVILLQFLMTFASFRWQLFAKAVRSEPILQATDGAFCPEATKKERVTQDEVFSAIRSSAGRDVTNAAHRVLESDVTISCLMWSAAIKGSA